MSSICADFSVMKKGSLMLSISVSSILNTGGKGLVLELKMEGAANLLGSNLICLTGLRYCVTGTVLL